jgi:hypothetical protein
VKRWAAAAALLAVALICAPARADQSEDGDEAWPDLILPGGFVIFYDSSGGLSYPSATPGEVPADAIPIGEVKGRACQYKLDIPFLSSIGTLSGAAGRGGYSEVFNAISKEHPGIRGLYDVKVDDHSISVLIIERLCTEVTAYGYR